MIDRIDLTLLHPEDAPANANWRMKDKLNGWTSLGRCRFLEWSGWYNYDVAQRLLGHYRLFHHFKADYIKSPHQLAAPNAYILHYRSGHGFKYLLSRIMSLLYSIFTKQRYPVAEIAAINRQLVNESSGILYDFLTDANEDFAAAFLQAIHRISDPAFLERPAAPTTIHNTLSATQINIQPPIKAGAQGKDKGIFSKKQVLILFDLLSAFKDFDSIDYNRPTKFEGYADLLHALTGKSKLSILEELNDYRNKGLYDWHSQGELNQLINILIQLANTFRNAGFRSFAKLVDRKIVELESHKED